MSTDEEFLAGNQDVIRDFRANGGVVSQLGFPVLLLTTTGARTGRRTTSPLGFAVDRGRVFVVASKGGAPQHPAWFHNLRAHRSVTVELGDETYEARALVPDGDERDRLYTIMSAQAPSLRVHEQKTSRLFPIVILEGVPAPDEDNSPEGADGA
jgi:deazaflavin-dependent oxidoreductase (nitroreductase family)